jgi:hypothetical protein
VQNPDSEETDGGLGSALIAAVTGLTRQPKYVYPFYFAARIRRGLLATQKADAGTDDIIESVGEIQTLGNSRYLVSATDKAGTRYHITIEVAE